MFGGEPRLFAGIGPEVGVDLVETIASPRVTHVRYAVHKPEQRHSIAHSLGARSTSRA